jgi:phosphate transport system substrate-binding protein
MIKFPLCLQGLETTFAPKLPEAPLTMKEPSTGGSRKGPPPIIFVLLGIGALWLLFTQLPKLLGSRPSLPAIPAGATLPAGGGGAFGSGAGGGIGIGFGNLTQRFPRQASVPAGTTISIDGSTSMVLINQALKTSFPSTYPGTVVNTAATGSDNGIQALLGGSVNLAAISRPLTAAEKTQGLEAVPVARDRIAIVVGASNPFRRSLSRSQLQQIFRGEISNWSTFGGPDRPIRVLNRPSVSGTHKAFRELVLGGADFGKTANITTLDRDATTPLLRLLGSDGISYATYAQVADQQTVRVVAVDGSMPDADSYPFQRPLFYVYRKPIDPAVKAFLGFALSADGQSRINAASKGS